MDGDQRLHVVHVGDQLPLFDVLVAQVRDQNVGLAFDPLLHVAFGLVSGGGRRWRLAAAAIICGSICPGPARQTPQKPADVLVDGPGRADFGVLHQREVAAATISASYFLRRSPLHYLNTKEARALLICNTTMTKIPENREKRIEHKI